MISAKKRVHYAMGYIGLELYAEAHAELAYLHGEECERGDVALVVVELAMCERKWKRVVELAPKAVHKAPGVERPWIAWAYALRELERIEEARDVLMGGALCIKEPSVLVDYNLACYFCLLGDLAEARRRLALVYAREPAWKKEARTDPDLARLRA